MTYYNAALVISFLSVRVDSKVRHGAGVDVNLFHVTSWHARMDQRYVGVPIVMNLDE